jgi:hypothetical protein
MRFILSKHLNRTLVFTGKLLLAQFGNHFSGFFISKLTFIHDSYNEQYLISILTPPEEVDPSGRKTPSLMGLQN